MVRSWTDEKLGFRVVIEKAVEATTLRPLQKTLTTTLIAVVMALSLLACGEGERPRPGELARAQWQRLVTKVRERAARARPAAKEVPPPADLAIPAEAPPPPPRRERPPRTPLDSETLALQAEEYAAQRPKAVVELQRLRTSQSIDVAGAGGRRGVATLINLDPEVNAWYLLTLQWSDQAAPVSYHLVNAHPGRQDLELDPAFPAGLVIADTVEQVPCDLWSAAAPSPLEQTANWRSPYRVLCGDEISVRLKAEGRRTTLEWATDFLRDNVWRGEAITVFVRETFFQDAFLNTSPLVPGEAAAELEPAGAPSPARADPRFAGDLLAPTNLGLVLDNEVPGRLAAGRWYPLRGNPGIFASVLRPNLVAAEVLQGHRDVVRPLDEVENDALAYLVAFDLGRFELAYALGTDHPRLGWSDRVTGAMRDASLPGPDGVGGVEPLVSTGIIGPAVADRAVATFTGGFKRTHGAFRAGDLAARNHGSHYGFIEQGVVFSKLQPGLATLLVDADGTVGMKTWSAADDAGLERVKFARQNGVPILAPDPATGETVPGSLVGRWGFGNWSGSQEEKFRTLRAGACLAEKGEKRFLIYGYFSTATPSAMARVFEAYGCRYAMQLDINALEHTYLAVYRLHDGELAVQHLIDGMSVLDKSDSGQELPRFLGFADNRDFFYLLKREAEEAG